MAAVALVALLLLGACTSEGEKAEERYAMVDRNAISGEERCAAARDVAQAYLKDRDEQKYAVWKNKADGKCLDVSLEHLNRSSD